MNLCSGMRIALVRSIGAMALLGGLMTVAVAGTADREQLLLDQAKVTIASLMTDQSFPQFKARLADAKAVLVVPSLVKAALVIGGEGGSGVLLARSASLNGWSYPAFYEVIGGSLGLQLGAEESETIFLIMTDEGLQKLMSDELKLGVDASAAVVDAGIGVENSTSTSFNGDIIAISRVEGLYLGASVEGAVVSPDSRANQAFYGKPLEPDDIVVGLKATNAAADPLRAALKGG